MEYGFLQGRQIDTGLVINLSNLHFQADSSILTYPESLIVLDSVFHLLEAYPTICIEIRGHSSGARPGTSIDLAEFDALSLRRSEEVAFHLVSRGIDSERIRCIGYGPRKPIATNITQEGRSKNQRVDIKIIRL